MPDSLSKPLIVLGVVGLLLLGAELLVKHKSIFGVDGTFGFSIWVGLLSVVAVIAIGKLLSVFLTQPDDYYDEDAE